MKIENLNAANNLTKVLQSIDAAIKQANGLLKAKSGNNFGHEVGSDKAIYSLHLAEHSDGSGGNINLTNCGVGFEIVKFAKSQLEKKRKKIVEQIEAL